MFLLCAANENYGKNTSVKTPIQYSHVVTAHIIENIMPKVY